MNWIPTAERLPDDEQTVLIVTEDGEVWTGYHEADAWFYVSGDQVGMAVTHWMDFPEPPVFNAALTGAEGVRVEGTVIRKE